jgi:F420-0:gamma-glutamyl ligase-like protein
MCSLEEFIEAVEDGNRATAVPLPTVAITKEIWGKLIDEAVKAEWQQKMDEIANNEDYNAQVKAHKKELLISKLCIAAAKSYGFKVGVDVKKAMQTFRALSDLEEDKSVQTDLKELEKRFDDAIRVSFPKSEKSKESANAA